MKLSISITTYNREKPLLALLDTLFEQIRFEGHEAVILIVDDHSSRSTMGIKNRLKQSPFPLNYLTTAYRHGKREHWKLMNIVMRFHRLNDWDLSIHLQDDFILNPDFIKEAVYEFQRLPFTDKQVLTWPVKDAHTGKLESPDDEPSSVSFEIYKYIIHEVESMNMHWIANRKFYESLDYWIYPVDETLWNIGMMHGTGVSRQISFRLNKKQVPIYQTEYSLCVHGVYKRELGN